MRPVASVGCNDAPGFLGGVQRCFPKRFYTYIIDLEMDGPIVELARARVGQNNHFGQQKQKRSIFEQSKTKKKRKKQRRKEEKKDRKQNAKKDYRMKKV